MANAVGEDRSDFQSGGQSWSASDFGFSKASEGLSWQSKTFGGNWARLKAQGKHRGAYHFFHPAEPAAAQAQFFVNFVRSNGGFGPGDMFSCDAEVSVGADGAEQIEEHRAHRLHVPLLTVTRLGAEAVSVGSGALAFCNAVAQLVGPQCPVLLYTFLGFRSNVANCVKYPLWIADYTSRAPASVAPWPGWTMWQNSDHGGQGGGDHNYFNGSAASLTSWISSHGDWTQEAIMALPTLKEGAKDQAGAVNHVRRVQIDVAGIGRWNNLGAVTAVKDDGNFGATTTAAVKAVQKFFGLAQDGVVGPSTWKKLIGV